MFLSYLLLFFVVVVGNTYLYTTSYTCNLGYYLKGSKKWICDQNGHWIVEQESDSLSPRSYFYVKGIQLFILSKPGCHTQLMKGGIKPFGPLFAEPHSLQSALSEESGSGLEDENCK